MGIFKGKKIKKEPKSIIISRTDKIGDLVLSIPAISTVKKMYPKAKLYVMVRKYNVEVVKGYTFIDGVIPIDDYSKKELYKKLKQINADIFIALYSNKEVLKLAFKSGAPYRIGPLSKPLSFFVYNYGIKQKRSLSIKNEAEYNLDLIKSMDIELFNKQKITCDKLQYGRVYHNMALKFLNGNEIYNYILIHPFSGGSTKNLTVEEYIKVIKKINENKEEQQIVVTSSLEDKERAEYIANNCKNVFVYTASSILEIAALIDKCKVYVGVGTGPSHIAGNLCKKAVCIYPKYKVLSPTRWGLYGNDKNTTYIIPDKDKDEKNYKDKEFDNITNEIIEEISSEVVRKLYE